mgnify:CR=1 FL=1
MMYDYVINKPELNEDLMLEHGFVERAHKYIKKYMGKSGKWVYVYNKASGAAKGLANTINTQVQNSYGQAKQRIFSMLTSLQKRLNSTVKKGKNLYYRGKSKYGEATVGEVRRQLGLKNPRIVTRGAKEIRGLRTRMYSVDGAYYGPSGKANSYGGQTGSRVREGIAAGRKRTRYSTSPAKRNNRPRSRKKNIVSGTARIYKHR